MRFSSLVSFTDRQPGLRLYVYIALDHRRISNFNHDRRYDDHDDDDADDDDLLTEPRHLVAWPPMYTQAYLSSHSIKAK